MVESPSYPKVFGRSPSFYQAEGMGLSTGVLLTKEQTDLYVKLREGVGLNYLPLSDQRVYLIVLEKTEADAEAMKCFKDFYPNIFNQNS